jgi:putative ABC transport system permease protein
MLRNYLTIAFRTITKSPGYASVNIFGLTVGITSFLLILLVIQYELSFDHFHRDAENILRINNELQLSSGNYRYPTCTSALAVGLYDRLPEVTDYSRLTGGGQRIIIEVDTELYREEDLFYAEKNFFEFFDFELLNGEKSSVLDAPYTAVLTESAAYRYFGSEDVIGKVLTVKAQNDVNYTITGLMADPPNNSHIQFAMLFSLETFRNQANNNGQTIDNNYQGDGFYSYIKVKDPDNWENIEAEFASIKETNVNENRTNLFNPSLTKFTDIHLRSNLRNEIVPNGSMDFVYIFSAVALFILVIAGINYMNLATARSAKRAQEVGIRKVLGAYKQQLIGQFLGESLMLTLCSALLSILIVWAVIVPFGNYLNRPLEVTMLFDPTILLILLGVIVIIGFGSGMYPALFLSAFKPVVVLKGKLIPGMGSSGVFRKALVVFQFIISIVMIIGTSVVYNQLNFMKNKSLGYQKEDILVVANTSRDLLPQLQTFKNELLQHPNIERVTATLSKPGGLRPIIFVKSETVPDETEGLNLAGINVDFDYFETMGIELLDGRLFDKNQPSDSTNAIIINKKAAQELNMEDNPVGRVIEIQSGGSWQRKRIIGLIDNINFEPLTRKTESCFYAYFLPIFQHIFIRLDGQQDQEVLRYVENTWDQFAPDQPFEYSFLEDDLNAMYNSEEELSQIVIYFALLAVLIACLGLFGLASFSSEQRIKEVGVRKVLGASVPQVLFLLTKDFMVLILISFIIAAPTAFFLTKWWLQNFAFTVDVSVVTFLFSGLTAMLIALITVAYKTYKAARSNPVNALRFE